MSQFASMEEFRSHRALARNTDPQTSHAAAASVRVPEMEATVLAWLWLHPEGGTAVEIASGLGVERDSVSPRLRPLAKKGLVVATDQRRPGKTGRSLIVWKVA